MPANNATLAIDPHRRDFLPLMLFVSVLLVFGFAFAGQALAGDGSEAGAGAKVLRSTLTNGLRVIIVRDPLAPVVTTEINYLVGSNEAPKGFPGMAHAQEHMMFRGSPGLTASQLALMTAEMGGNFDADTQQAVTQYFFTTAAKDLGLALRLEAIRMRGVLDTDALWKQERGAIEQEVAQDLSNPGYVYYTQLLAAMYTGTPYAHDALGTRASFDKTSGAMLRKFHDTWYVPNNAVLVIAGNVDPHKTLTEVQQLFGGIAARKLPPRPRIQLEPVQARTLHLDTDQAYGTALIAFRMPGYASKDYAASVVLSDILSSQRGKLFALVPEGKALSAGFSLNTFPETGIGFAAAVYPKGGDAKALLAKIHRILTGYAQHGVPADLVAAAKRHAEVAVEFQKNSISDLAAAWSQAVAVEGRNSPEDDVHTIQAVTAADVQRVARHYLDFDHAITAVLTPRTSGKPTRSRGFGGKESFAPKKVKAVKIPDWAKPYLTRLEVPASTVKPVVSVLPNGIRLIVQPETISNTVSVYGHINNKPDVEQPKGQEGVNDVLGQLFTYGTETLDRIAFQRALDQIGAGESAGTDFSLHVLKANFTRGVQLLADNELHPALPQRAFKVVQSQTAAELAGELQSPGYQVHHALRVALFPPHDPSRREATPTSVSSLTLADVKRYYRRVFRPDLTTIVVIGNITPQAARMQIEAAFGSWQAHGTKPQTQLPAVPLNAAATIAVPDASRVQDRVILAETLGINRFSPDYYALELGNHVLGGAFYATRLYRDLREQQGLVYYVGSGFQMGKTRGIYLVNYASDPKNTAKARAIIVRDLQHMRDKPVSPHELRQAKTLLLRKTSLAESSVDDIAGGLLQRARIGLPLNEPILAARRYLKLHAKQVQAAYARWIDPTRLVQVTLGPPAK
jgi:zinc protease